MSVRCAASGYWGWHTHSRRGIPDGGGAPPTAMAELCEVVKEAEHVRVLGRGHSFVPLCAVDGAAGGTMVSLNKMSAVLSLDETLSAILAHLDARAVRPCDTSEAV